MGFLAGVAMCEVAKKPWTPGQQGLGLTGVIPEGEQAGRWGRAGAEIWGQGQVPGPLRLPRHP